MITDQIVSKPRALFGGANVQPLLLDRRGLIGAMVLFAHLLLLWMIALKFDSPRTSFPTISRIQLLSSPPISTRPISIGLSPASINQLTISKVEPTLPTQVAYENITDQLETIPSGRVIPPHLAESNSNDRLLSSVPGAADGAEATVVLRIEVEGTGALARILVDVSGGSRQIDEAAIAHVRNSSWLGGSIDNQPATLWIRWAVRLHA